jgi:hypothetical protein
MNTKIVSIILLAFLVTGCIVHPGHHKKRGVTVKVPVETVVVLDKEHTKRGIALVYKQPARKRNCWKHNQHWHCNR